MSPAPVGYPAEVSELRRKVDDFGTCLDFSSSGIVRLGTANPFSGNFYWSGWVKWNGLNGAYQHIFSKRDSYGSTTMMFDLALKDTTGEIILDTFVAQKNFGQFLRPGVWTFVVWVHNVTDSLGQLYINGDLVSSQPIATLGTGTGALISLGATQNPAIESFNGKIDRVVIGNYAPTWAQVIAMYAKYSYQSVWTQLEFNEGSGSSATDSSGNGNNGTIVSATYATDKVMASRQTATTRRSIQNQVLAFNGTSGVNGSEAIVPFSFDPTGFNFGFFVKLISQNSSANPFFTCSDAANQNGFKLTGGTTLGLIQFTMRNAGAADVFQTSPINIAGIWVHVAVTFVPNAFKMYINGKLTNTDPACSMTAQTISTYISRASESNNSHSGLKMKNLVCHNRVTPWTPLEIRDIINRCVVPSGAKHYTLEGISVDQDGLNPLTLTKTAYETESLWGTRTSL